MAIMVPLGLKDEQDNVMSTLTQRYVSSEK